MTKPVHPQLVGVLVLFAVPACGEYFGSASLLPDATKAQLSDGLGECSGIERCINLDISTDAILTRGEWTLAPKNNDSSTYVKVRDGAVLVIEPGTVIKGLPASALIVTRGSKIIAAGTPGSPIVFTSGQETRASGSWGGVLLLGAAPVNQANALFEALPANDVDGAYGGADVDDSSGILRYVRIEFAGFAYAENREFNGLTLAGVGRGTTLDYIQVHRSSDDGIELFGGTADLSHIVSSQNEDDGFDTDLGYVGRVQFLVVQHVNAKSSDPNGYESDNQPEGADFDAQPRTGYTIYNATLIGTPDAASGSRGAVVRRGAAGLHLNHIIAGFRDSAVDVRNSQSVAQFPTSLVFRDSIFFGNNGGTNWQAETGSGDNDAGFDEAAQLTAPALNNRVVDPELGAAAIDPTEPSFMPSTLFSGATPPTDGFFESSASYIGAVGLHDWTSGWTAYPQD